MHILSAWKETPSHALLKCSAISEGCAGPTSRAHPMLFSTQRLKANSSKLYFPLLPLCALHSGALLLALSIASPVLEQMAQDLGAHVCLKYVLRAGTEILKHSKLLLV